MVAVFSLQKSSFSMKSEFEIRKIPQRKDRARVDERNGVYSLSFDNVIRELVSIDNEHTLWREAFLFFKMRDAG